MVPVCWGVTGELSLCLLRPLLSVFLTDLLTCSSHGKNRGPMESSRCVSPYHGDGGELYISSVGSGYGPWSMTVDDLCLPTASCRRCFHAVSFGS